MIQRSDRVADVLKRDEALIDAFVAASPAFERLRNPLMRKTIGRLSTVEQAARVAGLDPEALVRCLNHAAGEAATETGAGAPPDEPREENAMSAVESPLPPALARVPEDRLVDLDVREDLRNGREPFSKIMAARREVPPGGVLRLRAIFEPAPLYAVMAKQGFDHWTEELAADDWRVWFYPAGAGEPRAELPTEDAPGRTAPDGAEGEDVVVIDVRGMEPPEPMVHTLAALENLPAGKTLLQINERVPQFLLPKLEEQGFTYTVREQEDGPVRVFIRRAEHGR